MNRFLLTIIGLALLVVLAWHAEAITPNRRVILSASVLGITSVSPNSGTTTGGTSVTITGSAFTGATTVLFGASSASFSVVSSTTITATSPAHAAGAVDVRVTTPKGTSPIVAADQFTYATACNAGQLDFSVATGCNLLFAGH